jgi:hypothetical protein
MSVLLHRAREVIKVYSMQRALFWRMAGCAERFFFPIMANFRDPLLEAERA